MNAPLARLLTRLYPRYWRERYGAEFEDLLQTSRGGMLTSVNVVWSAVCERIVPTQGLKRDKDPRFLFRLWCRRAPSAIFSFAPLLILAGSYFVACFILWIGWRIFLPGTSTPFVRVDGLAMFYFAVGRFLYYGAPIVIGWGIGLVAARQGSKALWPSVGLVLIAFLGGLARVHASRAPGEVGHISMGLALGPSFRDTSNCLLHASIILSLTMLPYVFWRLQKAYPRAA
jgi:hypothetical protein